MLHANNAYTSSFKVAIEKSSSTEFQVVINANKKKTFNEYVWLFNLPTYNEVALIMADESFGNRNIMLHSYFFNCLCSLWFLNKHCNMNIFIIFLKVLFTCILDAKAAVYVRATSINKPKYWDKQ